MTSISSLSAGLQQTPLQRLQDVLASQVKSGTVAQSDQSALSSALEDIDSSIQSERANGQSGGARPSPGDLKSKIENLISAEVSGGKLTSDQAAELKGVFDQAFGGGPGGAGGPGGPGGAGGPPPGPPPSDGASSASDSSSSSATSSADDVLKQFLELLKQSLGSSSASSYGASGSNAGNAGSITALLVDISS